MCSEANLVGDHRPDWLTRINYILLTSQQQNGKLVTNRKSDFLIIKKYIHATANAMLEGWVSSIC